MGTALHTRFEFLTGQKKGFLSDPGSTEARWKWDKPVLLCPAPASARAEATAPDTGLRPAGQTAQCLCPSATPALQCQPVSLPWASLCVCRGACFQGGALVVSPGWPRPRGMFWPQLALSFTTRGKNKLEAFQTHRDRNTRELHPGAPTPSWESAGTLPSSLNCFKAQTWSFPPHRPVFGSLSLETRRQTPGGGLPPKSGPLLTGVSHRSHPFPSLGTGVGPGCSGRQPQTRPDRGSEERGLAGVPCRPPQGPPGPPAEPDQQGFTARRPHPRAATTSLTTPAGGQGRGAGGRPRG